MGCEAIFHTDSTEEDERRLMYIRRHDPRMRLIMSSSLEDGMGPGFSGPSTTSPFLLGLDARQLNAFKSSRICSAGFAPYPFDLTLIGRYCKNSLLRSKVPQQFLGSAWAAA